MTAANVPPLPVNLRCTSTWCSGRLDQSGRRSERQRGIYCCVKCDQLYQRPLSSQSDAPSLPELWLAQNAKTLGPWCIKTVRRILSQLAPPFMQRFKERKPFAKLRLPCFSFDTEYTRETGRIVGYRKHAEWEKLFSKGKEIAGLIARLPIRDRDAAKTIAWLCDERMRENVALEDCRIRWFIKTIEQEQVWLNVIRQLVSVQESENQTSLFHTDLANSLMKLCCPSSNSCDNVQKQLDRARTIVEEARSSLEPAKLFYLRKQPPRHVKQMLLSLSLKLSSDEKKKAAVHMEAAPSIAP